MKSMHSNVHTNIFNARLSGILAKIIFSVFVMTFSFSSYADTHEETGTEACRIRMELYALDGSLMTVQEAMKEDELSLREIKPGTYRMIISKYDGIVLFYGRITVPAPQLALDNK